ncbi:MAG: hypothetical protein ACJ77M_11605 [Thermoleophilaceae bacterium]
MTLSTARKVLASCLVLPPVIWALANLIGPNTPDGSSTNDQITTLNKIADHKSAFVASGILFLVGSLLFLIATYGIVHVYRGLKVGVGQVAGGLLALAMSVFVMFYGFGITQYEMINHAEFKTVATQHSFARLLHFSQSSGLGAVVFITFILGIVLGPILLGTAMLRRRNVPVWAGVLTILTGPVGFVLSGKAANTVFQLFLLAALTPLAMVIWRMTDEQWDAPRAIAGARQDGAVAPEPAAPSPAPAV